MRISILCGGNRVFGLEIMALTAARELQERGHSVYFVANAWNDGEFGRRLTAAGIPFQTMYFGKLSKTLRPRALWWTLNALTHLPGARKQLKRHFADFAPHVVMVYNRDFVLLARKLLKQQRTVFHVQELPPASRWTSATYRAIDRCSSAMIAVSHHIAKRLHDCGVRPEKIVVIHNGVEAAEEIRASDPDRPTTIGIVGQVGKWKGHDDLLRAMGVLFRSGHSFRCSIFGAGDATYRSQLEEKAKALGIADLIDWHGYVSDASVIYSKIDVCVIPSRFHDPCPVVAIEASLYGKPIVATRRGGLPELVVDGSTGFLVDAYNPEQLADRLGILLGDRHLRARFGHAAQKRAQAEFTATRMVDRIETLCAEVASPGPTSRRLAMASTSRVQ